MSISVWVALWLRTHALKAWLWLFRLLWKYHRASSPCTDVFCLPKRPEFRTACPIGSRLASAPLQRKRDHTEVLPLASHKNHSGDRRSTWVIAVAANRPHLTLSQPARFGGWVFRHRTQDFPCVRAEGLLMTWNITKHGAVDVNVNPAAGSVRFFGLVWARQRRGARMLWHKSQGPCTRTRAVSAWSRLVMVVEGDKNKDEDVQQLLTRASTLTGYEPS